MAVIVTEDRDSQAWSESLRGPIEEAVRKFTVQDNGVGIYTNPRMAAKAPGLPQLGDGPPEAWEAPWLIVQDRTADPIANAAHQFTVTVHYGHRIGSGGSGGSGDDYPRQTPRRRFSVGTRSIRVGVARDRDPETGDFYPIGSPYFGRVEVTQNGQLIDITDPENPILDPDAEIGKEIFVPEITLDVEVPPATGGPVAPLPAELSTFVALVTKVHGTLDGSPVAPFQGVPGGFIQYMGFDLDEIVGPGTWAWRHNFRIGKNALDVPGDPGGEPFIIDLARDWWVNYKLSDGVRKVWNIEVARLYDFADFNSLFW